MSSIEVRGDHCHPVSRRRYFWQARYRVREDRISLAVTIPSESGDRAFVEETTIKFDPDTTYHALAVRQFVDELIDRTDFSTVRCVDLLADIR